MICTNCKDEIKGNPIRQGDEIYCSLECANKTSGMKPESEDYFEEHELEGLYNEDEE